LSDVEGSNRLFCRSYFQSFWRFNAQFKLTNLDHGSMTVAADKIADAVLQVFEKLPSKRKPIVRDNGVREWIPLSGIVAEQNGAFKCLCLA
jgi:hypothetical protein